MEEFLMRDLLLSSTDSSSDSDEDVEVRGPIDQNMRPKIQNYVENIVEQYSEEDFRNNFRMSRITFQDVLERVNDTLSHGLLGRPKISSKTQLCVGLWYLSTPDSYRSVCGRFGLGKATGLRIVRRVVSALFELAPIVIKWPTDENVLQIQEGFNNAGFPSTIGAIDGCHIAIPQPKEHGLSYVNRKNFASLVLIQGVCDNHMRFIHCYAGEVGSSHDSRVMKKSEVWQKLTINRHTAFPNDCHIIGDKAYPCIEHLITPYRDNGHLTRAQRNFNYKHSCARSVIERAFGLLKRRFRILKYFDIIRLDWAPKYIIACCVLHNICLNNDDILLDHGEEPPDEPEDIIPNVEAAYPAQVLLGQQKRDRICMQIYEELNE